ncbi:MAG TPA: MBL fold metallo-hydrolase, partial [Myxococcota bacterium]|nr:MBL fold metallo-hydrolase [Myxococcota bacterium]
MRWTIGNVKVTRVIEVDLPTPGGFVLPDASAENVGKIPWLAPHFVLPDGMLLMSIHALVVESQGRKILVDTCLGNDKKRNIPDWNMRAGPFLSDLAKAGHPRESIDTVVCTHLHVDHVGWNTMKVGDQWRPTFL